MKRKAYFALLVFLVVGLFFIVSLTVFAHTRYDDEFGELSEISGKIAFKRPGGYFLTTDSGEEYKLVLGPVWHLENIGLELTQGDRVSVKGFEDEGGVFLVTSVKKGLKTYDVVEPDDLEAYHYGPYAGGWGGMMHHHRDLRGSRSWRGGGHCW